MRPNVYYSDPAVTIFHGDSIETMRQMPDNSVDSIVTDPPYGLGFMGKAWDALPPGEEWAAECLRVLKPGGHLLAFGGSRTWHRLAVAVEDAGFEIRDSIAWLYGSGFPKSLDVSKAIDKAAGAEREVIGKATNGVKGLDVMNLAQGKRAQLYNEGATYDVTAPATPAAPEWQGWGTALKPAFEPVVVGRKPLVGTVAQNVQTWGTGALNIDGGRIGTDEDTRRNAAGGDNGLNGEGTFKIRERRAEDQPERSGRWPANVVLDDDTAAILDQQSGVSPSNRRENKGLQTSGQHAGLAGATPILKPGSGGPRGVDDSGGASRFFYVAKAPKRERPVVDGVAHPTVKPLALMRWLIRLVTPPGGVVLDPFEGSGTTLEACLIEGFNHVGIEREADYLPLIMARLDRQAGTLPAAA